MLDKNSAKRKKGIGQRINLCQIKQKEINGYLKKFKRDLL